MSAQTMEQRDLRGVERGFTLIEIIITFVLIGIMAAMFSTFFTRAFTESSTPLVRLDEDFELAAVMENMIADFKSGTNIAAISTAVGTAGSDQSNNYGAYKVVENQYISFDASGNEVASGSTPTSILKVTIQSTSADNAQTLTYLFTE